MLALFIRQVQTMNGSPFQARNDLEHLLLEIQSGAMEFDVFANRMLGMQVFMPVRDEKDQIAGFQRSTQAEPLLLEDEDGQRALIIFSDPDRSKEFMAEFEDYSGGLLTEFNWILRRMGENMGISLNPGMDEGFDFFPDMIAMMCTMLPEATE